MGRLKLYKDGQFIEVNTFPFKTTASFTTNSVGALGGTRQVDQTFYSRALIRKLKVTPSTGSANSTVIEFFKDSALTNLEYQATTSGTFTDNDVWFHEDEDGAGQLHLKLTNNSTVDATYLVEITAEAFA